mmetsp:Transcript_4543/g.11340  ORF Transcript_4543/g.11340 Transcript_4543/m.11340 type:complete len:98 (-) Transcript_4543:518-811(-)
MFPQELIITFRSLSRLSRVEIATMDLRRVSMEVSKSDEPGSFELVVPETEMPESSGSKQVQAFDTNDIEAMHLKIVMHAGWEQFVCLYGVVADGQPL